MTVLMGVTSIGILTGCFKPDERRVGVDDFPNSINAQVRTYLSETKQSEDIGQVPSVADSILGLQAFHLAPNSSAGAGTGAMAKASAAFQATMPVFQFPALIFALQCQVTIKFDTTIITPLKTTVNSTTICIDSGAGKGSIIQASSVSTYGSGRVDRADISDADGDGVVNPSPTGKSKARFVLSTAFNGVVEKTILVVGPGPDNSFDTEPDNIIFEVAWTKIQLLGTDTLATATYEDADNDGSVIDNHKASLVDLVLYEKGPTKDHPDAQWSKARLRLNIIYGAAVQETKRVHFDLKTVDGRISSSDLLNLSGSPDFNLQSKLKAHFLIIGTTAQDTLDTLDIVLSMNVGGDLNNKSDDSIYAMDIHSQKKLGEEKSARFIFNSDFAIPSGQQPQSGTLNMHVDYTDHSSVQVEGKLSHTGMDVTVKTRDDKHLHVIWDALGRGVLMETIP